MVYYITIITMVIILPIIKSYRSFNGNCPDPEIRIPHIIDIKKIQGRWFEYARYSYEADAKCVEGNYTLMDVRLLRILYTGRKLVVPYWVTVNGTMRQYEKINSNSKVFIDFKDPIYLIIHGWAPSPRWIIGVDYDHFIIYWSCKYMESIELRIEYITILTRKQVINQDDPEDKLIIGKMWEVLGRFGHNDTLNLQYVEQTECED